MDILLIMGAEALILLLLLLPGIVLLELLIARKHEVTPGHRVGVVIFSLFILGMLIVTGVPSLAYIRFEPNINLKPFASWANLGGQYTANVILFLPFGFFLPCLWSRYRSFTPAAAGCLFSLAIELAQIFNFRSTDIDDLLMNTLGAAAGGLLYALTAKAVKRTDKEKPASANESMAEPVILLLLLWTGYFLLFPLVSAWI